MSSHIDITVDTVPMAQSINTVNGHITGTTTAVVAMQAAVIDAEHKAADHVCENVNRGFYTLIRSQISQKMAKLQSDVDSHLMQLNQQKRQLLSIRNHMEHDYQMISRRYTQLFTGINRNLEQRVYELDRPVMDFAGKEMNRLTNRPRAMVSTVSLGQDESVRRSQHIISSNVKYRGLQVLDSIKHFLRGSIDLNILTDHILLRRTADDTKISISMPALIYETRIGVGDNRSAAVYVSDGVANKQDADRIRTRLGAQMPDMQWSEPQETSPALRHAFMEQLEKANLPKRVHDEALRLFNAARTASLINNKDSEL